MEELLTSNPYRETAYRHLMVALMTVGIRVDALRTFTTPRQVLRERFGLDPGPELAALYQRVLSVGTSTRRIYAAQIPSGEIDDR
ncbi:BTAD domain-containing putative transcriptional regulator [Streptomyces sp. 11-1-2]|uniref:BTAD domain-containing putative transcriptional regulator n=1 Tax=unclassified Streptomyces TaxID=2593676 RepID=UPI000B8D234C|nr:BTAD domain-containing putative transcriptional regulator [Streptomyces sp. 11-1-2]ASQ93373.1 hypothetical protein CGL27_09895 [Streptomyces sp. 11-1-2]